jgi:DNA-binding transcriptional regulator YiaG
MTPTEIRERRLRLGMTRGQIARLFRTQPRLWRRWEIGTVPISGPVALLLVMASTSPAVLELLLALPHDELGMLRDE